MSGSEEEKESERQQSRRGEEQMALGGVAECSWPSRLVTTLRDPL